MSNLNWKEAVELIGMAAIVASLIFVGLELRQSQQIALNELNFTTVSGYYETRNAINQYADVWVKGNSGEKLTQEEAVIYTNLIRNVNTHAIWNFRAQRRLGRSGEYSVHDLAWFLYKYPEALKVWESYQADQNEMTSTLMSESDQSAGVIFPGLVRADLDKLERLNK